MNRIINKLVFLREKCRTRLCTTYVYFKALLISITIGSGCRFHGNPYIRRSNGSIIRIGNNCRFRSLVRMSNQAGICRPCTVETLAGDAIIQIGDNCGFSGTMISAAVNITIGKNVYCGANSSITDTDWHGIKPDQRGFRYAKKIGVTIEDNVWLGMNVVVLKGSQIGKNSVIASNSVVIGSVPENVMAGGNPAKVINTIQLD